jgi:hypothetical protein
MPPPKARNTFFPDDWLADGDCRLGEGQLGLLMTCLRLLWAGYYREIILQERSRIQVEGCGAEAIRRFKESVFGLRESNAGRSI